MTTRKAYTIFQEGWWLEATSPNRWDAVEVERGGSVSARLPFTISEDGGIRRLGQPFLTPSLGPWVLDTGAGYTRALSREMSLYSELIEKLPKHDVFHQNFAPQVTNWLPFYWEGFTQTTRYTYTIDLRKGLEQIRADMDKRDRRQLRDASALLATEVTDDLGTLLSLNRLTYGRQGLNVPYDDELVYAIDEAVLQHSNRWIVLARDKETGRPHAGIYMVQDEDRIYSLISGADPEVRNANGGIVARWGAIEAIHGQADTLDLAGSMIRSVERRNRNYGAVQEPYMALFRSNGRLEARERRQKMKRAPLRAAVRARDLTFARLQSLRE